MGTKTQNITQGVWSKISISTTYTGATQTIYLKPVVTASAQTKGKGDYGVECWFDSGSLTQGVGGNIVELTEQGLLIFNGYDNFMKFSSAGIKLKASDMDVKSLNVPEIFTSVVLLDTIVTEDLSNLNPVQSGSGTGSAGILLQPGAPQQSALNITGTAGPDVIIRGGKGGDSRGDGPSSPGIAGGKGGDLYLEGGIGGAYYGDSGAGVSYIHMKSSRTYHSGSIDTDGHLYYS